MCHELRSETEQAIAESCHATALSGRSIFPLAALGHALRMAGRTSEAQEVLETLTLRADSEYVLEFLRAHVYLGLGQMDKAFESLERAVVKRFDWQVFHGRRSALRRRRRIRARDNLQTLRLQGRRVLRLDVTDRPSSLSQHPGSALLLACCSFVLVTFLVEHLA